MAKGTCSVEACGKPNYGHGLCNMHWKRQWMRFRAEHPIQRWRVSEPMDRLMRRVVVTPCPNGTMVPVDTPCWVSTYTTQSDGYTVIKAFGRPMLTHRFSYEHFVGPIPAGLTLDHLCRVRACCNPAHLEAVTQGVNFGRGDHPSAIARRTGNCKHGHSLHDAIVDKDGKRHCRSCRKEKDRARYWANR